MHALDDNIFVVFGASKSGTTWLQKMLDSHADIRCHFQLRLFPFSEQQRKSLKAPAGSVVFSKHSSPFKEIFQSEEEENSYWLKTSLLQKLAPFLEEVLQNASKKYSVPEEARRSVFNQIYKQFIEIALREEGKKYVGTKSYTNLELMFELFPNAKCIHLVRDGRDVCVSKRFHFARKGVFFHGDEKSKWLYYLNHLPAVRKVLRRLELFDESWYELSREKGKMLNDDVLRKLAQDWVNINEYLLSWREKKPENMKMVAYEELIKDPHGTLTDLLEFIGVSVDPKEVDKIVEKTSFKELKKNQNDSFFRKGQAGDWENHFNERNIELFDRLAGDLSRRLGYE